MANNEGRVPIFKSIDDLVFDPKNPRLPTSRATADDADVFHYMLDKGNIIELMLSLATQGYFDGEPLLVIASQNSPGKFDVVEGNRRLAALKLLKYPDLAPIKQSTIQEIASQAEEHIDTVPVLLYGHRNEILNYLGYRHITGIKDWDSLAKAKYLTELYGTLPEQMSYRDRIRELAKIIGSRSDYVDKLLSGYEAFKIIAKNNFYDIKDLNDEEFEFSLLTTATSYKDIANFVGGSNPDDLGTSKPINEENLKELTEWIYKQNQEGKTRLRESRNLKYLNAVVSNEKALKEFRNGTPIEVAWQHTEGPNEFFSTMLDEALRNLTEGSKQLHLIEEYSQRHYETLDEISKLTRDMKRLISAKLLDQADED